MHHTGVTKTRVGTAAPRLCPGTPHSLATRRHCEGKHCIELRSGLAVLWWAEASLLTRADILSFLDGLRELSDGRTLPLVVHLRNLRGHLVDARRLLMHSSLSSRVAIVGTSPVDRVIAAFLETGYAETRYFECPTTAEAWARED
jgi:hypothetical protein